jgi:hypothetical protein
MLREEEKEEKRSKEFKSEEIYAQTFYRLCR